MSDTFAAPQRPKARGASSETPRRVSIVSNRTRATSPGGIYFEARAEGFDVGDAYDELRYLWRFDDLETLYTRLETDDLPWEQVRNASGELTGYLSDIAYGPHCSHVWAPSQEEFEAERERTGRSFLRKTVTVEVLSRAMALAGEAPVTARLDVLIDDPDAVFPGVRTSCISPSGDFSGAPAGALKFHTFEDAVAACVTGRETRVRFLLRRGEDHDVTWQTGFLRPETYTHMQMGAFGTGRAPNVSWKDSSSLTLRGDPKTGEVGVWGLELRGSYDPTRPREMTQADTKPGLEFRWGGFTSVWDCGLAGFSTAINTGKNTANLIVSNVSISAWYEYGFFAGTGLSHAGFTGVSIKQTLGTINAKGKRDPVEGPRHANHGPWRCSRNDGPVSFNLCDFRSLNSWSGSFQPCVRLGGNGSDTAALAAVNSFDRCRAENGEMIGSGTYKGSAYPKKAIYDKIYQVLAHSSGSGKAIGIGCGGMTIRNVVTVLANQPRMTGGFGVFVSRQDMDTAMPSNSEHPVRIYNSTFVDLRDDQNDSSKGADGLVPVHRERFDAPPVPIPLFFENNILFVPNRPEKSWNTPPGYVSPEPLDRRVLWKVTYDGKRFAESPFDRLYATPPDTAALYAPLQGSPALGSAEGELVAVDDFFGRLRGPDASRGAVEPV